MHRFLLCSAWVSESGLSIPPEYAGHQFHAEYRHNTYIHLHHIQELRYSLSAVLIVPQPTPRAPNHSGSTVVALTKLDAVIELLFDTLITAATRAATAMAFIGHVQQHHHQQKKHTSNSTTAKQAASTRAAAAAAKQHMHDPAVKQVVSQLSSSGKQDTTSYAAGSLLFGGLLFAAGAAAWTLPWLFVLFALICLPWRAYSFCKQKWVSTKAGVADSMSSSTGLLPGCQPKPPAHCCRSIHLADAIHF